MASVPRRGELRRSRTDRVIGGVCAGLAKYFDIDPVVMRVLFVVLALAQGAGVVLYIVLLIVMPEEEVQPAPPAALATAPTGAPGMPPPAAPPPGAAPLVASSPSGVRPAIPPAQPTPAPGRAHRGLWAGLLLVTLGAYLLVVNIGWLWWWDWRFGGPALLIVAGLLLLLWRLR